MENKEIKEKRDIAKDKKRIKKGMLITLAVLLFLGAFVALMPLITELLFPKEEDVSYNEWLYFEADYNKDILSDEVYLSMNRRVYFENMGETIPVPSADPAESSQSAAFFYSYFDCLVRGDYQSLPSFFTESCLKKDPSVAPERFTMQAVYDIHVKHYKTSSVETANGDVRSEIYEVSYRIFENNGTFRKDILPDETRTLVFELHVSGESVKINSVGHRTDADHSN